MRPDSLSGLQDIDIDRAAVWGWRGVGWVIKSDVDAATKMAHTATAWTPRPPKGNVEIFFSILGSKIDLRRKKSIYIFRFGVKN